MQAAVSRLCGLMCYTGQPSQFRYASQNALPLRELWGLGISGDLPILLIECGDIKDLAIVKLLLKAHAYYRMGGLWLDLVMPVSYTHLDVYKRQVYRQSCSRKASSEPKEMGLTNTTEPLKSVFSLATSSI